MKIKTVYGELIIGANVVLTEKGNDLFMLVVNEGIGSWIRIEQINPVIITL